MAPSTGHIALTSSLKLLALLHGYSSRSLFHAASEGALSIYEHM